MTLDEQIAFMEELLSDDDHWSCENAKSEYRQVQEWLKDYKRLLEISKDDLISRKSLKAKIPELDSHDDCFDIWLKRDDVEDLIDNAPTVEAYTPEQVKELVDLNKKLSEERPQGEWIEGWDGYFETLDCSLCGYVRNERHLHLNFCPNCGAKMKGNAE